ncbi:MAG: aminodeoxychorismate/anthranilate synthase component II [Oscillospiraceae bacterium]|jgi:anthranilate synthase component 2|nr:aminodeoxychorismate/anthranilate synthase component II [Oscillospiraceae bacterium]
MILLIDNYDSFSYNLYQMAGTIEANITVVRNDAITPDEVERLRPERIIISPGPGRPSDAGECESVIRRFAGRIPILGVCLGHQAICETYGATVGYAKSLMHGKQSELTLDTACPIFAGLPERIQGARYHSLAALEQTLPPELEVIARADDGEVMGVRLQGRELYGLQFHPESVLTPLGGRILHNFMKGNG